MADFSFSCPQCGKHVNADEEWRGQQSQCPHCMTTITIPVRSESSVAAPLKSIAPDERKCPQCGEIIKKEAVFCRWCKQNVKQESQVDCQCQLCGKIYCISEDNIAKTVTCPVCGGMIKITPLLKKIIPCGADTNQPVADLAAKEWFYSFNSTQCGPISTIEVQNMLQHGQLAYDTILWKSGMTEWETVRQLPQFMTFLRTPPPITGDAVNNTYFFSLAFVPVLGIVWDAIMGNELGLVCLLIFTIINTALCTADGAVVEKCGHKKTSPGWGAFFVPAYMILRAKTTNSGWWCVIVWTVCFFFSIIL